MVISTAPLFDPGPAVIREGRRFLYDARISSGHGDLACSSCHAGGNLDGLAWDLGDPNGTFVQPPPGSNQLLTGFHPLKGPMITQSMRGLAETQPLHWRGDRADFMDFNGAFVSLMGRAEPLSATDMQTFKDFVLTIEYPPNPRLRLDGSYANPMSGPNATRGHNIFTTVPLVSTTCVFCHAQPWGGHEFIINGAAAGASQDVVVPQLRNLYEKTGFSKTPGDKKRGFGYSHDGSIPTLMDFLEDPRFDFTSDAQRLDVEAFLLSFGPSMPAAAGAQRTIDATNHNTTASLEWMAQMMATAESGGCDLIVKGLHDGIARGWYYLGGGLFKSDRNGDAAVLASELVTMAANGSPLTWTGVPAGCGIRMGIDRDADGYPDQTEIEAGSDPADRDSRPTNPTNAGPVVDAGPGPYQITAYPNPAPIRQGTMISFALARQQPVSLRIYDVGGRFVATLFDDVAGPGELNIPWNGLNHRQQQVASGKYFYRIVTPNSVQSRSLLIVR